MLTVILTGPQGVKGFIVDATEPFTAVNVFPDPFRKFGLDQLLPVLCDGGFLFVQYPDFVAMGIDLGIEDANIFLILGLLKDVVGIDPLGAISGNSFDVAAVHGFGGHIPLTGVG